MCPFITVLHTNYFLLLLRHHCKKKLRRNLKTPHPLRRILSRSYSPCQLFALFLSTVLTHVFIPLQFLRVVNSPHSFIAAGVLSLSSIRLLRCSSRIVLRAYKPLPWHQKLRKNSRYTSVLKQHHDKRSGWIPCNQPQPTKQWTASVSMPFATFTYKIQPMFYKQSYVENSIYYLTHKRNNFKSDFATNAEIN